MPIKKTSKKYEVIEEELEKNNVVSSSSEEDEPVKVPVVKAKRVQSAAQRAAFEKAREKRAELVLIRKAEKDKEIAKYDTYKNDLKNKKDLKKLKQQELELKKYESSSEEEIVYKKKKPKKIVYISDDEEKEERKKPINITINNTTPSPTPPAKSNSRFPVFL